MNALSQEQLIQRLVKLLSRLADLANSDRQRADDAALLGLSPDERDEYLLLVKAAGYQFAVPGDPFCSLLSEEESDRLRIVLNAWDATSFQQRALAKEALLLLSTIFPPLVPRQLDKRGGGSAMKNMAIARMQLGL